MTNPQNTNNIIIYVGVPYRSVVHKENCEVDIVVKQYRYDVVSKVAGQIFDTFSPQIIPFSPITYSHYLQRQFCNTEVDWYEPDLEFLRRCDVLLVLTLRDWKRSEGVKLEIQEAENNGIPTIYSDPENVIETLNQFIGV